MTEKEVEDHININSVINFLGGCPNDWTKEIKTLNEISSNIGVKCWITKKEKGDKHDN
jgi:hypothetical protein